MVNKKNAGADGTVDGINYNTSTRVNELGLQIGRRKKK